jgi:hypothetical protein
MEGLLSDSLDSRCEEMAKEYVDEAERERERDLCLRGFLLACGPVQTIAPHLWACRWQYGSVAEDISRTFGT